MTDWDVLRRAEELARSGEACAVATVVWRQGPSSGKEGGRALITAGGELHGWIGGACAEPVILREARQVIETGESRLVLLGTPDQFGAAVPDGMAVVPISCQSEGALEIFIEPVLPIPHLVVIGRSPMARTLVELARVLEWNATDDPSAVDSRSMVVIATQGHHDEEALEKALAAAPVYAGLVASARRGAAVLGYLKDRGVPSDRLDRVHVPAGLDLGTTSHREIAVAVLAELVQLRSTFPAAVVPPVAEAVDPVCGMTVRVDTAAHTLDHEGTTYYFCCAGCRQSYAERLARC